MSARRLDDYKSKRDLSESGEPSGDGRRARRSKPIFVIQKHAARSLHYDFRLEVDGVLASWAVPKGPSTDPRDKRLAIQVEDHPLDYGDFEGVIGPGNYGAGSVIVWDTGTYEQLRDDQTMAEAIERGTFRCGSTGKSSAVGTPCGGPAAVPSRSGCWSSDATRKPTPGAGR